MDAPDNSSLHQREKIDRLADQFEREFKAGKRPRIEDYIQQFPDLGRQLLAELLALEVELRRAAGEQPNVDEYRKRFQNDCDPVAAVFGASDSAGSTIDYAVGTSLEDEGPMPQAIGRYETRTVLGCGGFGVVYLAHDPQLNRLVALKVPRRKRFQTPEQVARFIDEARTAANLKHPSLVVVHDVQEHDGLPYIVQEYIEGQNLGDWSAANQPSFDEIARVLVGVAEALGYAHQHGLTHCDLKLANVLMDTSGQPHVADFGLAVHESVQALRKGEVCGTPAIMAPEQVRGELHRVDGRTDIWAIGVMLYELLVGRRPFTAESREELYAEIQTHDPKPPRQIDRQVPRELERICLKCLSKRRTERYNTTDDLREDLLAWLGEEPSTQSPQSATIATAAPPDSSSGSKPPVKIIPKGLRSFDAEDADFFLELLPGPRDRDGLPDSIRFWKSRIEETDPDKTFSVGLIYGPSGCGKSSLVKAGLLPRLANGAISVFLEASCDDTEVRLLASLRRAFPALAKLNLVEGLAALRRGAAIPRLSKVCIVLDQFEQWLNAAGRTPNTDLAQALRHCDGEHVQAILTIRDDFYSAASRFMDEVEIPLLQGHNQMRIDIFNPRHARKVLTEFGRAYGALPTAPEVLTREQESFLDHAVAALSEDDVVIPVKLALLADMLKDKDWTPATLKGGFEEVGRIFLEETFGEKAPPEHRPFRKAAQQVLKTLLPAGDANIKGARQSREALLAASGYDGQSRDFEDLLRILDSETRLITPVEDEENVYGDRRPRISNLQQARYYQLTHDYLVQPLASWLTQKQSETMRGRAYVRLAKRAAAWNTTPENRHLPTWWEYATIRLLTRKKKWSKSEQNMMHRASHVHGMLAGIIMVLLALPASLAAALTTYPVVFLLAFVLSLPIIMAGPLMVLKVVGDLWVIATYKRWQEASVLIQRLMFADVDKIGTVLEQLRSYRRRTTPTLKMLADSEPATVTDQRPKLLAQLALVEDDAQYVWPLMAVLLTGHISLVGVIRDQLERYAYRLKDDLWKFLRNTSKPPALRFRAGLALAKWSCDSSEWSDSDLALLAEQLVASDVQYQPRIRDYLRPLADRLVNHLVRIYSDQTLPKSYHAGAANALRDYAATSDGDSIWPNFLEQ
jgi:serine/threonine protein kinase